MTASVLVFPNASPRTMSAEAQRRAAAPDQSAWVAASAGTGKTKVLVDRVLNLLLAGSKPQRLLCLTFTKAAAQEMALRLTGILRDWATVQEATLDRALFELAGAAPDGERRARARRLFADVLDTPGGLRIDTIHAFCQSLLRRFPLEANVAPNFQVLDERSAAELMQDCRDGLLEAARRAPGGELAQALATVTARTSEQTFGDLLADLMRERGRLKRLLGRGERAGQAVARAVRRLYASLELKPGEREDDVLREACADASLDLEGLRRAARALLTGPITDKRSGEKLAAWLADPAGRVAGFDDIRLVYFTQDGLHRARLVTKGVLDGAPGIDLVLARERERLAAVIEQRNAARTAAGTAALIRLGAELEARYRRAKDDRGVLDYDDLILAVRDLLLEKPGIAPWVLYKLDGGIDHILIDEAQDTNPEQWEVIEALTGEFFAGEGRERRERVERTVFAVGDVKQSIYSFQRADPQAFVDLRQKFSYRATIANRKWTNQDLNVSFRSTEAVLEAVDAVFADPAVRDGVALDGAPILHKTDRTGEGGLVELWPPVVPRERPAVPAWAPPVERIEEDSPPARLARLVARAIAGWIGRETLESQGRPIRADDVMILVRRRNALVDLLVRELKQAGVEVAGVDRMVLADQLAIMDLIALGRFLLLPDDDLTLATVLKGPLFGFSEERLFELAWNRGDRTVWESLRARAGENDEFGTASRELAELLARVDFVRPHELFAEVLGPRRGRRRIVERLGVEAHDPLDEFLAAALAFERAHPPALETFLHWIEAGREEVKRDLESHARDEVRIMTVHGAKGLQAPIVILPDTFQVPRPGLHGPRLLWTGAGAGEAELCLWSPEARRDDRLSKAAREAVAQAQQAEYRRLLYVALTRAQDRLYVCGYQDRSTPSDRCWYKLVEAGLRLGAESFEFAGPGGELSGTGLRLISRQTRQPKPQPLHAPRAAALRPEWWERAPPAEPEPPRPLIPSRPDGDEPPALGPFDADSATRRFRRGRLVHRLLQTLPDLAEAQRAAAARRFLARPAHLLSAEEQEAIARETLAVLSHPDWAALFGPESTAEVPVVGRVGTRILSGQIDRLVVTKTAVLVVDYKTNRPPPVNAAGVSPVYLRQMAAYRTALAGLYPGCRLRCALLWTDGPKLMELPADLLDRHMP